MRKSKSEQNFRKFKTPEICSNKSSLHFKSPIIPQLQLIKKIDRSKSEEQKFRKLEI